MVRLPKHPFLFTVFLLLLSSGVSWGDTPDTVAIPHQESFQENHLSYEVRLNPGKVIALDQYVKKWLKKNNTFSISMELHYTTLPSDGNPYAKDYNYPTFSLGLRYNRNHGTTMHREKDPSWGLLEPVDYESILGDELTVYGSFSRPFFRSSHWELAYYLGMGIGYAFSYYNKTDQIDDEFIGSPLNIYFTAGLSATYRLSSHWGVRGGIDFSHHSNGALYRPNKGANYVGPFLGIVYYPGRQDFTHNSSTHSVLPKDEQTTYTTEQNTFQRHLYGEITLGTGGKTMLEDWQETQFHTPPGHPDYRTDKFHFYMAYSLQADVLYRYARRWASGLGVDVFYGTYSNHIKELDETNGYNLPHSPWSIGIAAKHETFYGNLSVRVGIGYYLYRKMGQSANVIEKPYYERVGIHYSIPALNGLSIGFNVNAHLTKADFTELQISYPIYLSGKK